MINEQARLETLSRLCKKIIREITRKLNVGVRFGASCRLARGEEKGKLTVTRRRERERERGRGRRKGRRNSPSRQGENHKWSFLYQRRILRQGRGTAISLALGSWINRPVLLGNVSRQRSLRENTPRCRFDVFAPARDVLEDRGAAGSQRGCFLSIENALQSANLARAALHRSTIARRIFSFVLSLSLSLLSSSLLSSFSLNFANI